MKEQPLKFLYVNSFVFAFCQTHVLKTVSVLPQGNECRFLTGLITLVCATGITFSQLVINSSTKDPSFTINSTKMICCIAFIQGQRQKWERLLMTSFFPGRAELTGACFSFLKAVSLTVPLVLETTCFNKKYPGYIIPLFKIEVSHCI